MYRTAHVATFLIACWLHALTCNVCSYAGAPSNRTLMLQDAPPVDVCKSKPETTGCDTCTIDAACGQQQCGGNLYEPPYSNACLQCLQLEMAYLMRNILGCVRQPASPGIPLYHRKTRPAAQAAVCCGRWVLERPCYDSRHNGHRHCHDLCCVLITGERCIPAHAKVTVRSQAADPEGFSRFRPCCNSTGGVPWTLQADAGTLSDSKLDASPTK